MVGTTAASLTVVGSPPLTVRLTKVSKRYGQDGAVTALEGVTIALDAGSFTAVMGPAGAGKSTLLRCVAGLEQPTSGEVLLFGRAPEELEAAAPGRGARRHVGYVPPGRERTAIARVLAARPAVLVADEPDATLDTRTSREIPPLLRTAADELGQTVLLATGDPTAAAWADRVLFLLGGRVAGELDQPTVAQIAERMTSLVA